MILISVDMVHVVHTAEVVGLTESEAMCASVHVCMCVCGGGGFCIDLVRSLLSSRHRHALHYTREWKRIISHHVRIEVGGAG